MDPISVLNTLWRHKWVAVPVILLTVVACVYVMFFAQRSYQASTTYALITPKLPTAQELEKNPKLASVNEDNPYLRSPDSSLLSQVLITKLGAQKVAEDLRDAGLGTEYTVAQSSSSASGMLLQLSATGSSPVQAVDTALALGKHLTAILHEVQTVNGADESYLFTALPVDGPGQAKEMFSSRLRTVIIVGVGGALLLFGAVSVARSLEMARARRPVVEKPLRRSDRAESKRAAAHRNRPDVESDRPLTDEQVVSSSVELREISLPLTVPVLQGESRRR
jgi:hypothetical protein